MIRAAHITAMEITVNSIRLGLMELLSTVAASAVGYAAVVQAQSSMVKGAITSVLLIIVSFLLY